MSRKLVLIFAVLLSLPIIVSFGTVPTPTNTMSILPENCRMLVGEEMPLELDGFDPPNAIVSWDVDSGGIISMQSGWNAVFVAPSEPTVVTISVSIFPKVSGMEATLTRQCIVASLNSAPRGLAQATEMMIFSIPD